MTPLCKSRNNITVISIFVVFTSIISLGICISNYYKIVQEYDLIVIFPMIFGFCSTVLFAQLKARKKTGRITIYIFLFIQWLRMVLLPAAGTMSGYFMYYGNHLDGASVETAVVVLLYESIFTFFFCIFIYGYGEKEERVNCQQMRLKGSVNAYIPFIFIAAILFIYTGADKYKFFALETGTERLSNSLSASGSVIDEIISYGLTFIVILILYNAYKKYQKTNKKRYVYMALACVAFRICLISSEGRLSIIYLLGTFLLLLPKLFPEHRAKIFRIIGLLAVAVIGLLTIYKVLAAFLYDSYAEAIQNSSFNMQDFSSQIDSYFYGIKTVARNISFCQQTEGSLKNLLFDFLRNTFGIHYLFKGAGYTTLESYNLYIYRGTATSGYLLSSIAYGYLYVGSILAPVFTCINIGFSFGVEKKLNRIPYMEVYYIVSMLFMRLSVTVFSNFPASWNFVSRTLIIGFVVIECSSFFKRRR